MFTQTHTHIYSKSYCHNRFSSACTHRKKEMQAKQFHSRVSLVFDVQCISLEQRLLVPFYDIFGMSYSRFHFKCTGNSKEWYTAFEICDELYTLLTFFQLLKCYFSGWLLSSAIHWLANCESLWLFRFFSLRAVYLISFLLSFDDYLGFSFEHRRACSFKWHTQSAMNSEYTSIAHHLCVYPGLVEISAWAKYIKHGFCFSKVNLSEWMGKSEWMCYENNILRARLSE